MVRAKITTEVKTKAINAVQLWHGENTSLLELEAAHWREEFKKRQPQAILTRLQYESGRVDELTQALQQAVYGGGLFSEKKLVELRNFLQADSKSKISEMILKLPDTLPNSVFVLILEPNKILWSKSLPAAVRKIIQADKIAERQFKDLAPLELEKWIIGQAHNQGSKMSATVARQLAVLIGNNFLKLAQEIAKLTAYRHGAEIKADDINLLVEAELKDDTFALLTAVAKRDLPAAATTLTRQFHQGTSPQQLIGMLAWHLRTLMSVRQILDNSQRRLTAKQLAQELELHPFVVSRALQQIPYYSAKKLAWLYRELSNLDIKLKTSRVEPEALFGLFLSKLATLSLNQN